MNAKHTPIANDGGMTEEEEAKAIVAGIEEKLVCNRNRFDMAKGLLRGLALGRAESKETIASLRAEVGELVEISGRVIKAYLRLPIGPDVEAIVIPALEELEEALSKHKEMNETFKRVCAWCKKELPGSDPLAKKTSHGICSDCEKVVEAEKVRP